MNEPSPQNDHDAITRLVSDVRNIKDGQDKFHMDQQQFRIEITAKLDKMIENYVNRTEHFELVKVIEDHEQRLRIMEKWVWLAIGGGYVINMIIGFYLMYKH